MSRLRTVVANTIKSCIVSQDIALMRFARPIVTYTHPRPQVSHVKHSVSVFQIPQLSTLPTHAMIKVAPLRSFSTVPPPTPDANTPNSEEQKQPAKGIKGLLDKYGALALVTYLGIYLITLGGIFFLTLTGIGLSAEQLLAKMRSWTWVPESVMSKLDSMLTGASPLLINFAAAWGATKLTEPIRIVATGAVLPKVHRWFTEQLKKGRFYPDLPKHVAFGMVASLALGGALFYLRNRRAAQEKKQQAQFEIVKNHPK